MATKAFRFSRAIRFEGETYVKLDDVAAFFDYLAVENPGFAAGFLALREDVKNKAVLRGANHATDSLER